MKIIPVYRVYKGVIGWFMWFISVFKSITYFSFRPLSAVLINEFFL